MSKKTNKKRADKERKPAKITKYLYTVEEVSQEYRYWTIESNKPLVKDDGSKKDLLEAMDVTVNPQNTSAEREKLSNGAEVEVSFDIEYGDDPYFEYNVEEIVEDNQ